MFRKIIFVVCLLQVQVMLSQSERLGQKDLKVGLVLSGGGAKGFAHIGVLKVLEKAGVRIDYIGGTSMGAVVGGLYAAGYSANELDSILRSFNYDELQQDFLPRKSKSIYQKQTDEKYALTLHIDKGKILLPSAVSKGQNLFNLLSGLTGHVHSVTDFSKLTIPFFCVATNLETGAMEILETGFLPEAIKASGAFPTLLDPVIIDDKVMTDGGVVNNFPVDIMKKIGVDIIIGVDVQDKLKAREDLNSAPKIITQIASFQMYDDVDKKREDTDLYLHPDISNYTVVSFDKIGEIIEKGEEVANKQLKIITEIAAHQQQKEKIKTAKIRRLKKGKFLIDKIEVVGNKNYTKEYIQGKLQYKRNDSITYAQFIEGVNGLSATRNFKSIQYKFVRSDKLELHLDLKEETLSSFLRLSAHYDDLYKTGILLNFTRKHVLFKNDFVSADLVLGDNLRYNLDYFIDNGFHWSFGINSRFNKFGKNIFIEDEATNNPTLNVGYKTPVEYNDFRTQLFLQRTFSNSTALQLGAEHKYLRIFNEILINDEIFKDFIDKNSYYSAFSKFTLDSYDRKYFAKKGIFLDVNYKTTLFSSNQDFVFNNEFIPFSRLYGKLGYIHTFFNTLTFQYVSEAGVTFGKSPTTLSYALGGNNKNFLENFTSFYGYDVADLNGESFLKSTFTLRYEMFEKNHLSFIANFARIEDNVLKDIALFEGIKSGYAVGYGLDSFIGPIEIKYSWTPDTNQNYWFFNFGFWF